ncbi:MAG: ATP-binding cassette domain-containing protein [Chitinophagales bacterium]
MLRFINFKKSYGNYAALEIGDLGVSNGIYWIRGVNGSGKTTLLKSIAGILSFEGDIQLNGNMTIKKNPVAYRRLVNFAEAEPLFPEFLTGREMINLFAKAKDALPGQEDYFIESIKMQAFIDRPLGTYSSGMLKKLSLVLAFLGQPKLILLDEPLITLDAAALKIIYEWIENAQRKNGTGFFLSSHQDLDLTVLADANEIIVEDKTLKFIAE